MFASPPVRGQSLILACFYTIIEVTRKEHLKV